MKCAYLTGVITFFLFACNNSDQKHGVKEEQIVSPESAEILPQKACYMYNVQQDTVKLQLIINDKKVTGKLDYNMYEKDSRHGTIDGVLDGDIIKADYTYNAEGTTSKQQLWLKLGSGKVYEGQGDMKDDASGFVYTDTTNITYKQAFDKVDCE